MEFKLSLAFLVLALAMVSDSSPVNIVNDVAGNSILGSDLSVGVNRCNGTFNECTGNKEMNGRLAMASGREGHICYEALDAKNIPCNKRGESYYNCKALVKANPYSYGCNTITKCA